MDAGLQLQLVVGAAVGAGGYAALIARERRNPTLTWTCPEEGCRFKITRKTTRDERSSMEETLLITGRRHLEKRHHVVIEDDFHAGGSDPEDW